MELLAFCGLNDRWREWVLFSEIEMVGTVVFSQLFLEEDNRLKILSNFNASINNYPLEIYISSTGIWGLTSKKGRECFAKRFVVALLNMVCLQIGSNMVWQHDSQVVVESDRENMWTLKQLPSLISLRIIQIKLTVIKNGQITWMQKWDKYGIGYNNEVITWK